MHWLAYLHPIVMFGVLGLGLIVLLEGIQIRQARVLRRPYDSRRHRRFARVFVVLVIAGFAAGLASMAFLRGKPVFESVHALLTSLALTGLLVGGFLGSKLEKNLRSTLRTPHSVIAGVGLLFAFAALVAGFGILP